MKHLTRIAALGALLSTSLASTVPAVAGDAATDVATQVVRYGDLNLADPDGAKTLYSRLKKAARHVCFDTSGADAGLPGLIAQSRCVDAALDTAVKDVNKPLLTALHRGTPGALTASR